MPFIQNVSLYNIEKGFHYDAGENSYLIQIVDPDMDFPLPKKVFKKIFQFKFLDIEEKDDDPFGYKISDSQAVEIGKILKDALENKANVIVHCVAGVCRSGAVTEAGVCLGFDDTEEYRSPNLLVKKKLFNVLGFTSYNSNQEKK